MIEITAEVTDAPLTEAYRELLGVIPEFTQAVVDRTFNDVAPLIVQDLSRAPGPVQLPVMWTSERQHNFVMMQKGRGRMQSSRRALISGGWKYRVVYSPDQISSLEVYNTAPGVEFVEGRRQQLFHRNTGWLYAPSVVSPWIAILNDEVETALIKSFIAAEDLRA